MPWNLENVEQAGLLEARLAGVACSSLYDGNLVMSPGSKTYLQIFIKSMLVTDTALVSTA